MNAELPKWIEIPGSMVDHLRQSTESRVLQATHAYHWLERAVDKRGERWDMASPIVGVQTALLHLIECCPNIAAVTVPEKAGIGFTHEVAIHCYVPTMTIPILPSMVFSPVQIRAALDAEGWQDQWFGESTLVMSLYNLLLALPNVIHREGGGFCTVQVPLFHPDGRVSSVTNLDVFYPAVDRLKRLFAAHQMAGAHLADISLWPDAYLGRQFNSARHVAA